MKEPYHQLQNGDQLYRVQYGEQPIRLLINVENLRDPRNLIQTAPGRSVQEKEKGE